jgi:hypothetical protein
VLVISIKDGRKTFHKVFMPEKNSTGRSVNSLIIKFPYFKHSKYDKWLMKIESLWRPVGIGCNQMYIPWWYFLNLPSPKGVN